MFPPAPNARKKFATDGIISCNSQAEGWNGRRQRIRLHKIKFCIGAKCHDSYVVFSHLWRIHIFRKNSFEIFLLFRRNSQSIHVHKSSMQFQSCTKTVRFPFRTACALCLVRYHADQIAHEKKKPISFTGRTENSQFTWGSCSSPSSFLLIGKQKNYETEREKT